MLVGQEGSNVFFRIIFWSIHFVSQDLLNQELSKLWFDFLFIFPQIRHIRPHASPIVYIIYQMDKYAMSFQGVFCVDCVPEFAS